MKKSFNKIGCTSVLLIGVVILILFLGTKYEFLPQKISNVVAYFYNIDNKDTIDTSDYVSLSTLIESPLFEHMDLKVPSNTYIPSNEEISATYSGLYADTIVASLTNTDIIIQAYGIDITNETELKSFREQIVQGLRADRPDISFDINHIIQKGNLEIPTIEFSTSYDGHDIFSFIALINVNGQLVTVAVNSGDYWPDASLFFKTLMQNLVLK